MVEQQRQQASTEAMLANMQQGAETVKTLGEANQLTNGGAL